MARRERYAEQNREPLAASPYKAVGQRPGGRRTISRREAESVSDEAIVSEDLEGQQNPPASQGPLDRAVFKDERSADWEEIIRD